MSIGCFWQLVRAGFLPRRVTMTTQPEKPFAPWWRKSQSLKILCSRFFCYYTQVSTAGTRLAHNYWSMHLSNGIIEYCSCLFSVPTENDNNDISFLHARAHPPPRIILRPWANANVTHILYYDTFLKCKAACRIQNSCSWYFYILILSKAHDWIRLLYTTVYCKANNIVMTWLTHAANVGHSGNGSLQNPVKRRQCDA